MEQMTNGATADSPLVAAAKERLDELKKRSNKLGGDREILAKIAEEQIAEERRLEREGEEALRQMACLEEMSARAKLPSDRRELDTIISIRDYPTQRRTGRGLIVVRALDHGAAIAAMKPANKVGAEGVNLCDTSPEAVLKGLLSSALYPDAGTIQLICAESHPFALAAYMQAVQLSGAFAQVTTAGKSGS